MPGLNILQIGTFPRLKNIQTGINLSDFQMIIPLVILLWMLPHLTWETVI